MNKSANSSEEIKTQHGLIGFFDVLGYKNIIGNNKLKEAVLAVKKVLETTQRSDRKSTRLNSSHRCISYAVFCLKKKKNNTNNNTLLPHVLTITLQQQKTTLFPYTQLFRSHE